MAEELKCKKYLDPVKVKEAQCDPANTPDTLLVDIYHDMQQFDIAPDPRNAELKAWYKQEERKINTTIIGRSSYYVPKEFFNSDINWKS